MRGITDAKVKDINEVWNILQTGSNARAVGSNNVNTHSSRSHWLVTIVLLYIRIFGLLSIFLTFITLFQHDIYQGEGKE